MKILIFLASLSFIFFGCSQSKRVVQGSVEAFNYSYPVKNGIWYYLPKTVIVVEVIAEKRVAKPGPFFRFAPHLLNISDVITEETVEWNITGANIFTRGEPDNGMVFRLTPGGSGSLGAVTITPEGILSGINAGDYRPGFIVPVNVEPRISLADLSFDDTPYTREQLIKGSTAAMAGEVANEIFRLRETRGNILRGDVDLLPPDKGSLKMVLLELDRKENAFLALFRGKEDVERVSAFFEFVPDTINPLNTVLLRFSSQIGFLDKLDVRGTPVFIEVEVDQKARANHLVHDSKRKTVSRGLVYRNPVPAEVRVIDRTLPLTSKRVLLGQFGQTLRLPDDLLDKTGVSVKLDVTTGALERVSFK